MERVGVLINKLQEQLLRKADARHMLVTAQLLHNELLILANEVNEGQPQQVSVSVANAPVMLFQGSANEIKDQDYKPVIKPETEPAPVMEPMPAEENPMPEPTQLPAPTPEPEPIPHFKEQKPWYAVFPSNEEKTGQWAVDPVLEVPTLAHQEKVVFELNDSIVGEGSSASMNDKLRPVKAEMSSFLQEAPIRDLKKAISINDRHRFINELFRGDETMYERSIKTINTFHIFAEAEFWIQRELKVKLGWDTSLELVKTFDHLVKRRFS